jgi:hypothetical protein
MKFEFSPQIFEIFTNIKFHDDLISGSPDVQGEQTDMMKLTVAFRNFAKTLKKSSGKKKRRCIAMRLTKVTTRLGPIT